MKKNLQTKKIKVRPEAEGLRLDVFLNQEGLFQSRSQALQSISKECVFVNGSLCKKGSYNLKAGDNIKVLIPQKEEKHLSPYDFPLNISFEDEHILVVNKPAGLVMYPAPGHEDKTLVNILAHKTSLSPGSHSLRPGVVHRLDKDVSGLLIMTKTKKAQDHFIQQFRDHKVKREYWAVCLQPPSPLQGTVESWIARHPVHRQKFVSLKNFRPASKKAISFYKLFREHKSGLSWIKCRLKTGRTHQIRVHLSSLSCPIAGDKTYGGQKKLAFIKDSDLKDQVKNLSRIALHSCHLSFFHPFSRRQMTFKSSWPSDLKPLIQSLGFNKK